MVRIFSVLKVLGVMGAAMVVLGQSAAPAADADAVRAAVVAMTDSLSGDDTGLIQRSFAADTPEQKKIVEAIVAPRQSVMEGREAQEKLNQAVRRRFNNDASFEPAAIPAATAAASHERNNALINKGAVTINGDRAVLEIVLPAVGTQVPQTQKYELVRRGGVWKLSPDTPEFARMGKGADRLSMQNEVMAKASLATAADVEAGKFKTVAEVREALKLNQIKNFAALPGVVPEADMPPQVKGKVVWDLKASHAAADFAWPKESVERMRQSVDGVVYDMTVSLVGLKAIEIQAGSWRVSKDVAREKVVEIDFGVKKPMTAAEVRALVERIGVGEKIKKQMEGWPPKDLSNVIEKVSMATFHEGLADKGEFFVTVQNAAKFTGEKDSWSVGFRVDWDQPAGFWDEKPAVVSP